MSLSQKEFGELRSLYEKVYAPRTQNILEEFTEEDLINLTDEEIEEQVEEVFLECIEEGYEIDEIERAICEAVDAELQVLNEVTSPAKVAVARMKNKAAAAGGEGSGDAGAKARAKLNVSKQKVGGSSEKKASTLSKVKSAASKVKSGLKAAGKVAQGTVGVATRAVGTAQRAGSAVKSAAKSGYERGRHGAGGSSSSSLSASTPPSSSSSSSSGSSSSSSSSDGGSSSSSGSSDTPKKRKDGLLKRAIKKVVRGAAKVVSTGAGAVKAGADYVTNRARKESMNHTDLKTIQELYNSIYESQQVDEELINEDSRRMSNKQHTQRVRSNIKSFGSNYTPPNNYDPDANRGQGEVLTRKQIEKKRRKSLRQEEFDAFDVVLEFLQVEGYAETLEEAEWIMANLIDEEAIEAIMESENVNEEERPIYGRGGDQRRTQTPRQIGVEDAPHNIPRGGTTINKKRDPGGKRLLKGDQDRGKGSKAARRAAGKTGAKNEEFVDEAMSSYDRNRKRAAQRAAARNAARDAGKTGAVPGVGYVTPRRERETYTDEKGIVRHKSGAKNEELELDENRRAARAAGGYKDDSKKQTDPSKAGFTGISNSIADIMRQNKEIEARKKK